MDSPRAREDLSANGSQGVRQRLARSRERAKRRREQVRANERAIAVEVKRFISSWHAIKICETKRDIAIETLRSEIAATEAKTEVDLASHHAQQAAAAAAIRDLGQSDDDVAELLEISTKEARQLIAKGRSYRSGNEEPNHRDNRPSQPGTPHSRRVEKGDRASGAHHPSETPTTAAASIPGSGGGEETPVTAAEPTR